MPVRAVISESATAERPENSVFSAQGSLQTLLERELRPAVGAIDRDGVYPKTFLQTFGQQERFLRHRSPEDLLKAVAQTLEVGRCCGSTGFLLWCQHASAWYLAHTTNQGLAARFLPNVSSGVQLAGTALSNPMKHFQGFEPLRLSAREVLGGFEVSGALPWISNLGANHTFTGIFSVGDRNVMAYFSCEQEGLTLLPCPEFCALEGTATFGVRFNRVFVPTADVLADPAETLLSKIKAGFVLLQAGLGLGLIRGALDDIEHANSTQKFANTYLPHQPAEIAGEFASLLARTKALANTPDDLKEDSIEAVLQLRLEIAEAALKAATSAALHSGALGFTVKSHPQRRLREAHFFAILTPSVRHLRAALSSIDAKGVTP